MPKTKYNPPTTIENLTKIYYQGTADEINRHEKFLRNPANSESGLNEAEMDVKNFLSKIGEVIKINEDNKTKPPDFTIKNTDFFFEVKSVNTVHNETYANRVSETNFKDENEFIEKLNGTIDDTEKKASTEGLFNYWCDMD